MNDQRSITGALNDYYRAFSTLQLGQITPYFHEPAMFIAPGRLVCVPDSAALASLLSQTINDLRTRGYGHSEFEFQDVKQLNATAASVHGIAVRYKSDGGELERVGITYVLHHTEGRWKIAVMILET